MALSARNQLQGTVEEVRLGDIMAHVVVKVGENHIENVITRTSAESSRSRRATLYALSLSRRKWWSKKA